ncbi:hypothetical protein HY379_00750 [Candidatus Saccharibacteria bacterium]|nr:hypothetical protein [Candidatus Saccharibacteria bacterium]
MVRPEVSGEITPSPESKIVERIVDRFMSGPPAYVAPVSIVDGKVEKSRLEVYDVATATVDIMGDDGYDVGSNLVLKEKFRKAAEKEIEDLPAIIEERQKFVAELSTKLSFKEFDR